MKKILVPTDFSSNSKAGMRFAIQWASQQKLHLIFIHALNILRATRWSDAYYEQYAAEERQTCKKKFDKFITSLYAQMKISPGKYSIIIAQGSKADQTLIDICNEDGSIDAICISTRGAGTLQKMIGTNTGNLIKRSPVPVMAVPQSYRRNSIYTVLYATDLVNYSDELRKVVDFAKPLEAKIDVLHFTWPGAAVIDEKLVEAGLKKQFRYSIDLHVKKPDSGKSIVENLQQKITEFKPSVTVMFTKQNRTLFEKIFVSSKSQELSYQLRSPLLVFNKNG